MQPGHLIYTLVTVTAGSLTIPLLSAVVFDARRSYLSPSVAGFLLQKELDYLQVRERLGCGIDSIACQHSYNVPLRLCLP